MPERARRGARIAQRLVVVTGKGGVGKSTIAAALAQRSAQLGVRTLLVVPAERDERHPLFGTTTRYAPTEVAANLSISRVDGHSALKEYVHRTVWPPRIYDWFLDSRALAHFTEAAPGFEELMCLGKLYDLATSPTFGRVVFDAPSTGHALLMLGVPRVTTSAVRAGALHRNAQKIQSMLEDEARTTVVTVALAEEMSVRETLELRERLHTEVGLALGPVIVNRVRTQLFSADEIEALGRIGAPSPTLCAMVDAAQARYALAAVQATHVETLQAGCDDVALHAVSEVVRDRFDGARLVGAVGDALAPIIAAAS